ncbi:hypothetical protein D3C76_1580950 [compost metagenome]
MVAVKMCADHRQHRSPVKHLTEHLLPDSKGLRRVHAGIDHHPAGFMLQQVQVDVVKAKRQRHAQPQHPGSHFAHLATGRWLRPGIAQAIAQLRAVGVQISHGGHLRTAADRHAAAPLSNRADSGGPVRRG